MAHTVRSIYYVDVTQAFAKAEQEWTICSKFVFSVDLRSDVFSTLAWFYFKPYRALVLPSELFHISVYKSCVNINLDIHCIIASKPYIVTPVVTFSCVGDYW